MAVRQLFALALVAATAAFGSAVTAQQAAAPAAASAQSPTADKPDVTMLYYRGISIEEFVGRSCFEEVVYLLWNLRLPHRTELSEFKKSRRRNDLNEICGPVRTRPNSSHASSRSGSTSRRRVRRG